MQPAGGQLGCILRGHSFRFTPHQNAIQGPTVRRPLQSNLERLYHLDKEHPRHSASVQGWGSTMLVQPLSPAPRLLQPNRPTSLLISNTSMVSLLFPSHPPPSFLPNHCPYPSSLLTISRIPSQKPLSQFLNTFYRHPG